MWYTRRCRRRQPRPSRAPGADARAYGWRVQAIRTAARELGRFTSEQMAKHLNDDKDNVHSTLRHLARRGELQKKGIVYFWVDPTTPDE